MRFIFFILMLVGFLYIPQGFASENTNLVTADFTAARLKLADAGKVAVVVDSKTILMADGKIIRLLGVGIPCGCCLNQDHSGFKITVRDDGSMLRAFYPYELV